VFHIALEELTIVNELIWTVSALGE
jgi:hypothetical protein